VQQLGNTLSRGHLRLASGPTSPGPGKRLALRLRALGAALAVLWSTLLSGLGTLLALLPLLFRPAPVGRRVQQRRPPREARIIPFQPRRRAVPR
jgi:hypothetical protein